MSKNFSTNQLYALVDNKELRKEMQAQKKSVGAVITLSEAKEYNKQGFAIYWTPNTMNRISKLTEHTDDNVTFLDYYFVDIDFIDPETNRKYTEERLAHLMTAKEDKIDELLEAVIPPTMIVETRNGVQAYWKCGHIPATEEAIQTYKEVQERLVYAFGGDTNAMNRSRFLRYPNFYHLKDVNNPYKIAIAYDNDQAEDITAEAMLNAYPQIVKVEETKKEIKKVEENSIDSLPLINPVKAGYTYLSIEEAKEAVKPYMRSYIERRYGVDATPKKKFVCINSKHEDSSPSMEFYPDSNKVYCYGCGTSWDLLSLIAEEEHLDIKKDFVKVLKIACDFCGFELDTTKKTPKDTSTTLKPTTQEQLKEEEEEKKINYTEYFDSLPEALSSITPYLQERGISNSVIKRYGIKYDAECKEFFGAPAIIFPRGCYSYNARTLKENVDKKDRYRRNAGEAEVFNIEALYGNKPVVITEGEIDSLSVIEASNNRVDSVALGGAQYHTKFISKLKELTSEGKVKVEYPFIIAVDNDNAGETSKQKLIEGLEELGYKYLVAALQGDKYKDINEALLGDKALLETNISQTLNDCVYMLYKQTIETNRNLKKDIAPACDFVADFQQHIKDNEGADITPTGYEQLDAALVGGLREGLYIIGAISSLGKTTFCLQMADQIAKSGRDVIICSLEQSKYELIAKSISRETLMKCKGDTRNAKTSLGVSTYSNYKNYSHRELELIEEATESYRQFSKHIYIYEANKPLGVEDIREQVSKIIKFRRPLHPEGYKPVVIVDYLQILKPLDERATVKQNNDNAISILKLLSKEFSLPVIAISSLNRENYKHTVSMSSFKETGNIEYGCDVLMGLQLKGVGTQGYNEQEAKGENERQIELVILKNRNAALPKNPISYVFHTLFNFFDERPY